MDVLHRHNYDIVSSLQDLVPATGPKLCRDQMEEWSASEANLFEEALDKYGKSFRDIWKDFVSLPYTRFIYRRNLCWSSLPVLTMVPSFIDTPMGISLSSYFISFWYVMWCLKCVYDLFFKTVFVFLCLLTAASLEESEKYYRILLYVENNRSICAAGCILFSLWTWYPYCRKVCFLMRNSFQLWMKHVIHFFLFADVSALTICCHDDLCTHHASYGLWALVFLPLLWLCLDVTLYWIFSLNFSYGEWNKMRRWLAAHIFLPFADIFEDYDLMCVCNIVLCILLLRKCHNQWC